jgi:transposase
VIEELVDCCLPDRARGGQQSASHACRIQTGRGWFTASATPSTLVDRRENAIVQESLTPGASVSQVARLHGIAPNQLFTWRRRHGDVAHRRAEAGDTIGLTSRYRILESQIHHLEWLLGKRTLENEMLRQALELAEATLRRHYLPLPGNGNNKP